MSKLAINKGTPVRTKPWPSWPIHGEREIELLTDVVKCGQWSFGSKEGEFAAKFAEYQGAKHGICVSGGARALEVALRAADVGPGDEVIIPALTFVGTAEGPWSVNAVPVLVDVDPDTYCIDPARVEEAITEKTKAIIPVYICGCMPDMDAIMKIASKHNLIVVEDAARAHGSRWNGKGTGTIGHLGGFSLQSSKAVNCGEGGIILTDDDTLDELCRAYRNNGRGTKEHVFGRNYRISEFQAAVALAQLERVDEQVNRREENALYLAEKLAGIDGIRPMKRDNRVTRQNYYTYVFRYQADKFGAPKERFVEAMNAEGIPLRNGADSLLQHDSLFATDPSKCPLACHEYGKQMDYSKVSTPVAEQAAKEAVSFGQQMLLGTKEDMDDIVHAVLKIKEHVDELQL